MFNLKKLVTPATVALTAIVGISPIIAKSASAESIDTNRPETDFNNGVLIAQPAVDTGATDGENEDGDLDPRSEELDSGNVDLQPNDEENDLGSYENEPLYIRDMNEGRGEEYMDENGNYREPYGDVNEGVDEEYMDENRNYREPYGDVDER